ncbi:MAG: UDP-N-acetylmuramoyl-tripeptide--D-alanyl-D-alanine ligase [Candidatus Berkelbacteria bacterium Licking1014_7]|uniref:UDP-N-acetylmuramoyl-tripeptide--D-alanyl-D-alanine ligase n=1 Tax=Candidatus Berkelbacteria bacterium Licking1014_7 TaxID=2017147 RepID=A0A554LJM4_9BACT|nr:MAG: UDP-N-acetylmuramoyl-tripeptide--D-alanyl-D-alanine ligase [Candidatus Berkelbacteria bacterium Licking1014_7]
MARFKPEIIAITGPAGKTSTKEMVYAVLKIAEKRLGKIGKSHGNLNTKFGIPLAILQIKTKEPGAIKWLFLSLWALLKFFLFQLKIIAYPKILVLEVGADQKGDLAEIVKELAPKIGALTNVGPAHLEFFKNTDELMKEKMSVMQSLPADGLAILPSQGLKREWIDDIKATKRFFDVQDLAGVARQVADYYRLNGKEVSAGLKMATKISQRLNVISSARGYKIIDDTYNANPVSVPAALIFLQKAEKEIRAKRKIVVLADMLELGSGSKKWHQKIGKMVKKQVDLFVSYGDLARYYQAPYYFDSKEKLTQFLLGTLMPGDIILVKGSRGMKMEEVVEKLIDNPKPKIII